MGPLNGQENPERGQTTMLCCQMLVDTPTTNTIKYGGPNLSTRQLKGDRSFEKQCQYFC